MEKTTYITINCVECGEVVELNVIDPTIEEEIMHREDLCENCFHELYFQCDECDNYELKEDREQVEQLNTYIYVCGDCIDYYNNDRFAFCDCCNSYKDMRDYEFTEVYDVDHGITEYYCESCRDNTDTVFYCEYHERYENAWTCIEVRGYGEICHRAFEYGEFSECCECHNVFHEDDIIFSDDYDAYCEDCYEEYGDRGQIKGYHNHKCEYHRNTKILNDNDHVMTYGFELEVEQGDNSISCGDMSNELYNIMDEFTVYESDGSLDNGFEIISNPYDIDYYHENGKHLIKCMLEELRTNNYKSHDTTTCGLHVHVGRHGLGTNYGERDNTIMQIGFVIEYFKEELTKFSRRKDTNINRWAKFTTSDYKKEELTLDIINKLCRENRSRYSALNLQNDATIEFRIFRGTLKQESFLATLELVHNICMYCKEHQINNLDALDFKHIATYDLNEYVEDYLKEKGII